MPRPEPNYFTGHLRHELIEKRHVTIPVPKRFPRKGGHAFVVRRGIGIGFLGRALSESGFNKKSKAVATHRQTKKGYERLETAEIFEDLDWDEIHKAIVKVPRKARK